MIKDLNLSKLKIEKANNDLSRLNEEKTKLINMVAHDLKGPLGNVKSLVYFLKEATDGKDNLELIFNIDYSLDKMSEMINKTLNVEALKSGTLKANIKTKDVKPILSKVIDSCESQSKRKNIRLVKNFGEKNCVADIDEQFVIHVFENLISNAIKFSPPAKTIKISIHNQSERLHVLVEDQGPGINEADQKIMYKKYQKLSARPTAGENSTGLGLYIVKDLVQLMGAKIEYSDAENGGAIFKILFKK